MENELKIDIKVFLAIIATGIMTFAGILIETAMNITFPTLMEEFNILTSTVQWMTTGYLLVVAIIVPISSFLKRRFLTKNLFVVAILFFIIGLLIDGFATNFTFLLVGRLLQGVGTGIALPLMFNIILEQVPRHKMGMMMGIAMLITAIAPALGPTFAGIIVSVLSWRYIFIILLPFLLISLFIGLYSIKQVYPTQKTQIDYLSFLFIVITFVGIVYGFSSAGEVGFGNSTVLASLVIGLIGLLLFVKRSLRIKNPIINLKVFTYKPYTLSVISFFMIQLMTLGLGFAIPNYIQIVLGEIAMLAGLSLLPGAILGAILAPISGKLLDKYGAKKPIITGASIILISLILFSAFGKVLSISFIIAFYLFYMLGLGLSFGNTMTNGLKELPKELNTDGNAIFNTFQQLGGAIGTSVVATLISMSQQQVQSNLSYEKLTTNGSIHAFFMLLIFAAISILSVANSFKKKSSTK